ncbi:Gamma-DL-glutamyl hydrolase [Frondihabitans sp. 762G35]|uniref:C40 family peptidase n=1 Tax=Frondihabitans sp. 762G35 TaxID=1446794 RepID=UPI000D2209E2|nr:C40 family peptidase [Frondihabitans sp. 762G35]ARC55956.1 Gamma-DL-glutamyl hydrolase [Frondihabitans sp. 762G35]
MTTGNQTSSSTPTQQLRRTTPRTDPIRTGPIATVPAPAAPLTRRAAREADSRAQKAGAVVGKRPSAKKTVVSVAVMTITAGLFGTMALPAFAQTPTSTDGTSSASAGSALVRQSQSVSVSSTASAATVSRDDYTTTLPVVVKTPTTTTAASLSTKAAASAEATRASFAASTAYSGKTASDYLAAPAHPAFSLAAVYQTALQYVGTPYVFGGATPAGFDCSGFVMYVYAQYGISLAHSVPLQSAAGTTISQADAQPGDIVVFNNGSHDGFYAGNGMILDAPKPGGFVSVRPLWSSDVHFVRFGIK